MYRALEQHQRVPPKCVIVIFPCTYLEVLNLDFYVCLGVCLFLLLLLLLLCSPKTESQRCSLAVLELPM